MKIRPDIYLGLPYSVKNSVILDFDTKDLKSILQSVCDKLDLEYDKVKSKSRKREHVTARMIAISLSCKYTDYTLKEIGKFYKRDHSTIIYCRETFEDLIETKEPYMMDKFEKLGLNFSRN